MARARKPAAKKIVPVTIPEPSPSRAVAHDTKDWLRNAADERAAKAGMIFDAERGVFVCNWIEENCYLYEGSQFAGKPMRLIPYQREFVMRLYSWVYWSEEWNDYIRRFTKANLLCAKKNGKTPLMAANGLYLTCADGEAGQKVYQCAKNGKQAGIAQAHAIAMVEQSPALDARRGGDCIVNRSTGQITHNPTRSRLAILSGDDTRGAQANEGINGSILIDELHVFDREMADRTARAGRSRKEPISLAVSTAGDDPSSYGFERTEYGRQVNEGKRDDLHFLHVEYSAPQKATDEQLADNLEEYLRAANPAIGYTVRLSELKDDFHTSKDKATAMARCKQYTFNIWVGSVSPWLSIANWDACKTRFTLADLAGRECKLGIDLSRTRDMTAIVLAFPAPEEDESGELVKLYPFFWMPKKTAEARKHLFPYLDWAACGDLTLTEGNVVDYNAVENELCEAIEEYELVVTDIFFDQHYAEELTQRLCDRLNANRTAVSQTLMTLSPLCKEFERRIDSGKIAHPGNLVLDWQVGHVQVWRDRNDNVRPVKPDQNSGKCIDGILAILDTFAGIVEDLGGDDTPGLTFF